MMKGILLATSVAFSFFMIANSASASSDQRPETLLVVNSSKTPVQVKSVTISGKVCAACAPETVGAHSAWMTKVGNKTTAWKVVIATPSGAKATLSVDDGARVMGALNDPAVATDLESVDAYMGSFDNSNLGTYATIFIVDSK
jgi:hypothetical protein